MLVKPLRFSNKIKCNDPSARNESTRSHLRANNLSHKAYKTDNREVKISLRQRQRERFLCVDVIISCVLPGFLFVIVVVDDEMEEISRSL